MRVWLTCTTTPSADHASAWRTTWSHGSRAGEVTVDVGAVPTSQPAVLAEANALLAIARELGPAWRQVRHLQVSRGPLRDYLLGNNAAAPGLDRALPEIRTWQRRHDVQLTRSLAPSAAAQQTQFCLLPRDPWAGSQSLGQPPALPNGLRMALYRSLTPPPSATIR